MFSECPQTKFKNTHTKISNFQQGKIHKFCYSKITRHEEKWENASHNEEKSQSAETDLQSIQVLE